MNGTGTPRPLEATIAWWSDTTANVLPGIMGNGKAGIYFERNQWRFHSGETFRQPNNFPDEYNQHLTMNDFSDVSETLWTGSWGESHKLDSFVDEHDQYYAVGRSNGYFNAEIMNTAVPIPSAFWLLFSGFIPLVARNKKKMI